ncbi:hypothetical protein Btru_070973 [Bulinus truncatus]|nr:hypothetical protein Btru_070973 [Bulinus truncatus]
MQCTNVSARAPDLHLHDDDSQETRQCYLEFLKPGAFIKLCSSGVMVRIGKYTNRNAQHEKDLKSSLSEYWTK